MDVIEAASYLQIGCVINMCARHLYETLTFENVAHYSQVIEQYGLDCLIKGQQSVVECIATFAIIHFTEIYDRIGFSNMSYAVLRRVMSSNDLTCSEVTVYDIVREWIQANPAQTVERKRDLVDRIHFLCMSKTRLMELKTSEEALDDSYLFEKIDKALHYLDPDTSLAERLEIGTPEKLIRGPPSLIVIGGPPTNTADDSVSDAVQVLLFDEDVSPPECCWGWGQSGSIRPPCIWSSVASMDGMMFICGGQQRSDGEETIRITNKCYIFDPILWHLKEIASMNVRRASFALVACDGYLYAIGGVRDYSNPIDVCQTIERYSLNDNCWTTVGHLPKHVFSHAATSTGHLIYMYGGIDSFRRQVDRFCSFDPSTAEWRTLATPDFDREGCTLLAVDHRLILARPGIARMLEFNIKTEQWSEIYLLDNDFHDFEEPASGSIGVVNTVLKEPMLFFLGGYVTDETGAQQHLSNIWLPLNKPGQEPQGSIVPLPDLKHKVNQPLCTTVPMPSFRLEALKQQIFGQQIEHW